jgi:S-adenosylmethionine hydrolase
MKLARLLLCALTLLAATTLPAQQHTDRVLGFMTDFDVKDDAIGICKAVMVGIDPTIRIIDITHQSTPYDIQEGARFLAGSAPYFPADAVIVVVIDPTVGSTRKAIIAKSARGQFFVLPDNGLITLLDQQPADKIVAAREITNTKWMIGNKLSSTFHGRDIFSPTGAHLARGDDWTTAGPALDPAKLVRLNISTPTLDATGIHTTVLGLDGPFGNVILNVPSALFEKLGYRIGENVPATIDGHDYSFPFVKTFSDVPVGSPLFYIDSRGRLALSINQRNFSEQYHVGPGAQVLIAAKK